MDFETSSVDSILVVFEDTAEESTHGPCPAWLLPHVLAEREKLVQAGIIPSVPRPTPAPTPLKDDQPTT